ncbi:HAD-superfamily hydrolase, subfamily IA, variant 3 [Cyanobacterium stanieri PCC 7202]|uniref:HAD-superfamily hydrolase, subfamily IA, variant 3 n=1 Tax=Cyanobacterium stanieri (strain ATCC 29140 / PCC 7202) TaxID=292563 RepID=K9YH19_CYASC|nr:HAD-superfamily hydrolase, subfamily IA, variant 3 [Cyanobacterium stanieri PCC 7202]
MNLKALLFDFSGVIINDENIHRQLVNDLLINENLRPSGDDYYDLCFGRCDRFCLKDILEKKGRVVTDDYIDRLALKKAQDYRLIMEGMEQIPLYETVIGFIRQMPEKCLHLALVTGASLGEVEFILDKAKIKEYFDVIVTGEDVKARQPHPDGYLLAMDKLNQKYPDLDLQPNNCLVIEDTPAGIEGAKNAQMQVVGITHTYPFHMLHRKADWCVDYLAELDLDLVNEVLARA